MDKIQWLKDSLREDITDHYNIMVGEVNRGNFDAALIAHKIAYRLEACVDYIAAWEDDHG